MRITCSTCNETRNLNQITYDKMLSRYAILRGFKLGLTTSIAGIFDKRFLLP